MSSSSLPPLHQPLQGLPGWLVVLGALTAIGPLSIDMYLPAFPAIAAELGADSGQVQLTLAIFLIGLALGQLFYGPISDRFGRKPLLCIGLILYVAASLGAASATDIGQLQGWRLLQALGGCAGVVIARAAVRDRCDAAATARAFSLLTLVMGAAPILAPLIGGLLLGFGSWRTIFIALALFGVGLLLAVHFGVSETVDRRHTPPLRLGGVLRQYGELLGDRQFLLFTLCAGLGVAAMFAYIVGSPFVLIELQGLTPGQFAWVFGANAGGLIAASQLNGWLLRRVSMGRLLSIGLWLAALATLIGLSGALLGDPGLGLLLPVLFLMLVGLGFVTPNASAIALARQGRRAGSAAALMGTLQYGLGVVAGAALSLWHDGSSLPLLAVMALCGSGAWCCYFVLARHHIHLPATQPAK
jgi:DHA1 family bicyclomycin/chloramphenicol resistance-like MFS transporter